MRAVATFVMCVVALVVGAQTIQSAGQQPLFRGGTSLVDLYVTVTGEDGRLVRDLEEGDFLIYEDGQPQSIVLFEPGIRRIATDAGSVTVSARTITATLMIDTSRSTTDNPTVGALIVAGAQHFVGNMWSGDRARVGSFNHLIKINPSRFVDDPHWLNSSLARLHYQYPPDEGTMLYDAMLESIDALVNVDGRRVSVVLTDGQDYGSDKGWGDVRARAVAEDVMIYGIGLEVVRPVGDRWVRTTPDRNLRKLANETGGGYFELDETDQLHATFGRVAEELHSQYIMAFEPAARDGKVHSIEVEVVREGMTARARKSYVATVDGR